MHERTTHTTADGRRPTTTGLSRGIDEPTKRSPIILGSSTHRLLDSHSRRSAPPGRGKLFGGWRSAVLALLLGLLLLPSPARAHEGPPFPIIVDHVVGPMLVSVWTDPDIGTGTFFVVVEPRDDRALPEDLSVRIGVAPTSGRLDEVLYTAEPQDVRYGARYYAEVAFDRGEFWNVRVLVDSPEAGGVLTAEVEATPDGVIGPIGLVLYLLPFLAVGFIWTKAILRRRALRQELAEPAA